MENKETIELNVQEKQVADSIADSIAEKTAEQIRKSNPFENVSNVKVTSNQKHFPIGRAILATAKGLKERRTVDEVLIDNYNQTKSEADAVALHWLRSQYEKNNQFGKLANLKALGIGSVAAGSGFSDADADADYYEALKAASVVRSMNGIKIKPMVNGQTSINKGSATTSTYWLGSGTEITNSDPTFAQTTLTAKKLAALTFLDNDAIRFDLHGIEQALQTEMIGAIGQAQDNAFINSTGSSNEPNGIINQAGNTAARTSSPTVAKVMTDLKKAQRTIAQAKVAMSNPYWIMSSEVKHALEGHTDANSNPTLYARQLNENGNIFGIPVADTPLCPSATVVLVDAAQLAIGEGYGLILESDSSFRFSYDQTAVRGITSVDFGVIHDDGIYTITSVDWHTAI